ncbi:PAS domain-containing protein [Lyngbya confervoides]|uniref:histidine kinase n=1 Tax=Lyngbya confervoides BDU141951 TaxID=1574623 RepID=A0ABD4T0A4_9CYAN|nr:PAS domain-containing protein [Lyngbya confervoides]MCM1982096.1 PAS domain-containing protein [Lyngbya confervoides BDU141951]
MTAGLLVPTMLGDQSSAMALCPAPNSLQIWVYAFAIALGLWGMSLLLLEGRKGFPQLLALLRGGGEANPSPYLPPYDEPSYQQLAEEMPALICRFLPDSTLTYVNTAYCDYFQKSPQELLGRQFLDLLPEDPRERQAAQAQYLSLTPECPSANYEHPVSRPDGSQGWHQWIDRAFFDDQGRPVSFQSIGLDITRQKESEAALRDRLAFEQILSTISQRLVELSLDELKTVMSDSLGQITQHAGFDRSYLVLLSADQSLGTMAYQWSAPGIDPFPPEWQQIPAEPFAWWMGHLTRLEAIQIPDAGLLPAAAEAERLALESVGTRSLLAVPLVCDHQLIGYIGFSTVGRPQSWTEDVVQRLKFAGELFAQALERWNAEQALRQSQQRLQALAANIPGVIYQYVLRPDGTDAFTYISPRCRELFELDPEAILADAAQAWAVLPPEDEISMRRSIAQSVETMAPWHWEGRFITASGQEKWVQGDSCPNRQADGSVLWDGLLVDISDRRRAAEIAQEQQAQLDLVVQASQVGFYVMDLRTQSSFVSPAYKEQLGYLPEDPQASPADWKDRLHPEDKEDSIAAFRAFLRQEKPYSLDFRLRHRDGSYRWIYSNATLIFDSTGQPVKVVGTHLDISDRKESEIEIRQLNGALAEQNQNLEFLVEQRTAELITFINALPDYIYVIENPEMTIRFCNDLLASTSFWETRSQTEGKTIFESFPADRSAYFATQNRQVFESGETLHIQESFTLQQQELHLDTYKIPLKSAKGEVYALIGSSRDVTELVVARRTLLERSRQLETINQELESFSYSVSHDLRAPLRHIGGFVQALQLHLQHYEALSDPKVAHYLKVIESSSHKMSALIDGLLTLSRLGRKTMILTAVPLCSLVNEAIQLTQTLADSQTSVHFVVGELPTVQGDTTLLQQVLVNLISNAVKFSQHHPAPQVEINSLPNGTVFVRDNGVGFQMDYADKLFGAFQRLHTQTQFPGTGIGLAIVQRIIHRHGGEIWAESQPNQGATFYFNLPLVPSGRIQAD